MGEKKAEHTSLSLHASWGTARPMLLPFCLLGLMTQEGPQHAPDRPARRLGLGR